MQTLRQHQALFTQHVPELQRMASAHFRYLNRVAREEAVQNALGLAWKHYYALIEKNRQVDVPLLKSCLFYGIKQTKSGRTPQGTDGLKPKDVYTNARKGNVRLDHIELSQFVSKKCSIFQEVSFRIDVPAFLDTLSDRQRKITEDLMQGMSTGEVAQAHRVSASAISQWRTRFKKLFDEFMAC